MSPCFIEQEQGLHAWLWYNAVVASQPQTPSCPSWSTAIMPSSPPPSSPWRKDRSGQTGYEALADGSRGTALNHYTARMEGSIDGDERLHTGTAEWMPKQATA